MAWVMDEPRQLAPLARFGVRTVVSSDLLRVEALRALDRRRAEGSMSRADFEAAAERLRALLAGVTLWRLSRVTLERVVRPLPPVGTLDGIHLATALLLREREGLDVETIVTHDDELAAGALALGFSVLGHPQA